MVRLIRGAILTYFLLAALGPLARADEGALYVPVFGPPPRLATTPKELESIKAKPDFAARRNEAVKAADELVAHPLPIPHGNGGWVFDYANPENGHPLVAIDETHHKDPSTGKIFTEDRYVISYRGIMHGRLDEAAVRLGWAYAYTGDDKYAGEVRRILLQLADDYENYPARLDRWGHTGFFAPYGGRRYVQSLDESYGVIKLAQGYDLTRNSPVWTAEDKATVESKFFRPTSDSILRFTLQNNHQSWFNCALVSIGSVLGDADLIHKVVTMDCGFKDQLNTHIGSDGMWDEGTMAYQNYALQPLMQTADYLGRLGIDIKKEPKLRLMILAPLHAAYPNGQLPAINDSDRMSIGSFRGAYEWGFGVYKEPIFAQAAAWKNPAKLKELLGPDAVPVDPVPAESEFLPDGGLAILRQGDAEKKTCLFIDYGPHGGGHGHYDKLNLMLYANGREWLLDPGRLSYSHKEYKTWVKETVAHNTVVLGGVSQNEATGKLLWFDAKPGRGWDACCTEAGDAYPGQVLRRSVLLTPRMLVDVFEVEAAKVIQMDWVIHAEAAGMHPNPWVTLGRKFVDYPSDALGNSHGYQHLTSPLRWAPGPESAPGVMELIMYADKIRSKQMNPLVLGVWMWPDPDETVLTMDGIGYTLDDQTPTVMRRRKAKKTRFITVYDLSGSDLPSNYVDMIYEDNDHEGILIDTHDKQQGDKQRWAIHFSPNGVNVKRQ